MEAEHILMDWLMLWQQMLTAGDDPWRWPLVKLTAAVGGGVAAHFVHNERLIRRGESPVAFWWRGFWFTVISAAGGLSLIRPDDAQAAFCAGLMGWFAVINFMHKKNMGGTELTYDPEPLDPQQLQKRERDER